MHKHIISGLSTAGHLRQYLREPLENFIVFEDSLLVGPLTKTTDIDDYISKRAVFWKEHFHFDIEFFRYSLSEFLDGLKKANQFTLWLSPSAHDQIFWAWLTHVFEDLSIDWDNVNIKHLFNRKDSKFPYITLGELRPKEFSKCEDFNFTQTHIEELKEAYEVLCFADPKKLSDYVHKESSLPELNKSLRAYLKFYPDSKTGLTIAEKALLTACKDNRLKSARIIGEAMMSDEYDNCLAFGDSYLFRRLVNLSQHHMKRPLVEFYGTIKSSHSMRWTEVNITDFGKEVLSGKKNNLIHNDSDDYIGGVHLSSNQNTNRWFYENGNIIEKTLLKSISEE